MPRLPFLASLFLFLGAGPAMTRDLQVEVELLHVGGLLTAGELESLLADARLAIEAGYQPTRLVEGVTARRERTMPLGSKLFAIPRSADLGGAQVERKGRSLRFRVTDAHPEQADYRLDSLTLRTPMAPGPGRPQPDLRVDLVNPVPRSGAHETAVFSRQGAFDLGLRLRLRWSDVQGAVSAAASSCQADIQPLGNGQYRFRPRHRASGLFEFLAPVVQSDPPSRPPAGQRSFRLAAPFPEPLAGWRLSRNHLVQVQVGGQVVERLSLYAEQSGPAQCRRTRSYDALFAGGQIVAVQRSLYETECGAEGGGGSVSASWLDDGGLARYESSTSRGGQSWDGFTAAAPGCGASDAPPAVTDVQALKTELQRIRDAFLRP